MIRAAAIKYRTIEQLGSLYHRTLRTDRNIDVEVTTLCRWKSRVDVCVVAEYQIVSSMACGLGWLWSPNSGRWNTMKRNIR